MDQALFDTQWGGRPIATGYDRDGFVIGMPPYFNEFGWKGGVPGSLDAVQGGVSSSHMLPNGSPSQAYPELSRITPAQANQTYRQGQTNLANTIAGDTTPISLELERLCSFAAEHPDAMQRIQTTSSPDDLHALGQCLLDKDALSTEFDEEKKRKVYINAGLSAFTKWRQVFRQWCESNDIFAEDSSDVPAHEQVRRLQEKAAATMAGQRDRLWLSKIAKDLATTLSFWPSRQPGKRKEVERTVPSTSTVEVAGQEHGLPISTITPTELTAGLPVVSSPNPSMRPPPANQNEIQGTASFPAPSSSAMYAPNHVNNAHALYDHKNASLASAQSDPISPVSVPSGPISSISSGPPANHTEYRHMAEVTLHTWYAVRDCLRIVQSSPAAHDFVCKVPGLPELPLAPTLYEVHAAFAHGAVQSRPSPRSIGSPQDASTGFPQDASTGFSQTSVRFRQGPRVDAVQPAAVAPQVTPDGMAVPTQPTAVTPQVAPGGMAVPTQSFGTAPQVTPSGMMVPTQPAAVAPQITPGGMAASTQPFTPEQVLFLQAYGVLPRFTSDGVVAASEQSRFAGPSGIGQV